MKLSFTFDQTQLSWQVSKRVSAEQCHLTVSPAQVTWDQVLFSFRFENYIPAGKRECMRTAQIGPDLRLRLKCTTHWGNVFFLVIRWSVVGFNWSQAQVYSEKAILL